MVQANWPSVVGVVAKSIGLVIREAVDVEVILVKHSLVLLLVCLSLHVVEDGQHDLEGHAAIGASLMLGALSDNLEEASQLFETSVEVELTHEAFNVEHVWEVVSEI